jgi:hypothetical protein
MNRPRRSRPPSNKSQNPPPKKQQERPKNQQQNQRKRPHRGQHTNASRRTKQGQQPPVAIAPAAPGPKPETWGGKIRRFFGGEEKPVVPPAPTFPKRQPKAAFQASPPRQNRAQNPPAASRQQPREQTPRENREQKPSTPVHWREALVPFLAESNYQPLDEKALARKLRVPHEETAAFTTFLNEEETAGRIMQVRHSLYVLPKRLGFCVGRLQMNERGFGFLVPIDPAEPDFFIGGEDTATAFHGDLVLARLKEQRGGRQRDSRLRGEVVKVLQRKRRQLVGTLRKSPMF